MFKLVITGKITVTITYNGAKTIIESPTNFTLKSSGCAYTITVVDDELSSVKTSNHSITIKNSTIIRGQIGFNNTLTHNGTTTLSNGISNNCVINPSKGSKKRVLDNAQFSSIVLSDFSKLMLIGDCGANFINVLCSNTSSLTISNMTCKNIMLNAHNLSRITLDKCVFNETSVTQYDTSSVELKDCIVEELYIYIAGIASAVVNGGKQGNLTLDGYDGSICVKQANVASLRLKKDSYNISKASLSVESTIINNIIAPQVTCFSSIIFDSCKLGNCPNIPDNVALFDTIWKNPENNKYDLKLETLSDNNSYDANEAAQKNLLLEKIGSGKPITANITGQFSFGGNGSQFNFSNGVNLVNCQIGDNNVMNNGKIVLNTSRAQTQSDLTKK